MLDTYNRILQNDIYMKKSLINEMWPKRLYKTFHSDTDDFVLTLLNIHSNERIYTLEKQFIHCRGVIKLFFSKANYV